MDYKNKLLLAAFAGVSFMFAGCSNDNDVDAPVENLTVVEEGSVKPAQKAASTQPTAILGSGGSMSGLLAQTFTNIVEPNDAKHVIVACPDMDTYKDELLTAYQRGIILTIVDPEAEKVDKWCNTYGLEKSSECQVVGGSAPASTLAEEACQSGFEWNFDGWLTGGSGLESDTPTPLQQGGWTWNNLTENSNTGIKVDRDRNTGWNLHVANLPYDRKTPVPDLATGDLTFRCSWIWGVPQAVDGSTDRFYMNVDINPVYYWHWCSLPDTKIETDYITAPYGTTSFTFMLIPPSRAEGQRL